MTEPAFLVEARRLLRSIRSGGLATVDAAGHPFVSLANVATGSDGAPLFLLSTLAAHTRQLEADPRCSLLLSQGGKGDPLAHPRLTVSGRAARSAEPRVRARFLARHPKAALYADFGDFSFWRMSVTAVHLNGGFARAATFAPDELLLNLTGTDELLDAEASALDHMNGDHADALRLFATKLAGEPEGPWRATGLDPEGLDLLWADRTARIVFPERIAGAGRLRHVLAVLAREARAKIE